MILTSQLTTLELSGLIRLVQSQPDIEYLFRHALIYDAVHGSLVKQDRSQLHALVGEILERQYPDRLTSRDLTPLLAYHFDQGQDHQRALKYYSLAGDAAFASFANLEAITHYSHALEFAKQLQAGNETLKQLYTQRGRAYEMSGQYPRAESNYTELAQLAQARGDQALSLAALISLATIYLVPTELHDQVHGAALLEQALALARTLDDRPAQVKILWNTMLLHRFSQEQQAGTARIGEEALRLARELGLKSETAYILNDMNFVYFMAGDLTRALEVLHEAQVLWRELHNLPMLADSLSGEVENLVYDGQFDRALEVFDEVRQLSESIGNLWNQSYSRYVVGLVYFERGEIAQAQQVMEDCIRLAIESGFIVAQAQTRCDLAMLYAYLGRYQTAIELLNIALEIANRTFPAAKVHPLANLARVYSLMGEHGQAEDCLAQINIEAEATTGQSYYIYYWLALSETNLAQAKYTEALSAIDRFEERVNTVNLRPMQCLVDYMRGQALVKLGRLPEAEESWLKAKRLAEALNARRILSEILLAFSEIEARHGQDLAAYKLRQQAKQLIEFIAAHIDQIELRESFINLPRIRSILNDN